MKSEYLPAGSAGPRILEARLRLLLAQWPIVWGGNLLVMALCCIILWPYYPHTTILIWFGSNIALFLLRLKKKNDFETSIKAGNKALRHWAHEYTGYALIGGLIWGVGAWIFFNTALPELTLFLLIVLVGITGGGLPPLSSYFPAYAAFSSGLLIPLAVKLLSIDWEFSNWLAFLSMVYLLVNLFYSRNLNRTIKKSITVDLRNASLLEEVTQAKELAEQANKARSSFLAAVSHDLRQPLHAMGLFLESLNDKLADEKAHRQLLDNISGAHNAMSDMFGALLEISKLEAGAVQPVIRNFRIKPIIEALVSEFVAQAQQKGLQLKVGDLSGVVKSDTVLLSGVLRNLLSNAIKYTDMGVVSIEVCKDRNEMEIRVSDTGHGIPEQEKENIFSEYHQLENRARTHSEGLGLGLAVVKRTSHLLDHRLEVESTLGKGSVFSIWVSLGQPELIESVESETSRSDVSGTHILVIYDEDEVRQAMSMLLENWGCLVTVAESEIEAIKNLDGKRPPDLLICDYRLGDEKIGTQIIDSMRQQIDLELPAFLMTGDTNPQLLAHVTSEGFYMLHKPVKPAHLRKVMAELIQY